jgi:acetolactate synthase-1/2/3 large subunit
MPDDRSADPTAATTPTTATMTVGEAVTAFLEACGVRCAFGVISIHNMPVLDAMAQRGAIRFVPARGEAGACNMADAQARFSGGLGVCITSTGTAAGNAAGAMVEALTAGTPLLHLTGQIETPYLDRDLAYIHEARDQLAMLRAVSKAAWRVRSAETALGTLKLAVQTALTAPTCPHCRCPWRSRTQPRWTRWRRRWPRRDGHCCGWAAARAMPVRRCGG